MEFNLFQNNSPLKSAEKKGWKLFKFTEILKDDTKNATKIKKENYLSNGTYPIIDQGKQFVAGYCNDEVNLYKNYPVIIFGDHTRIIKYINFPIYLGADGVKLFKVKEGINVKYIYYFLENVDLPNDGYSRHYKYLKDVIIAIPNLETQKNIAEVLDKAQELIDKRKEQIKAMDELVKSRFIEMFGNVITNSKNWDTELLGEICELKAGKSIKAKDIYDECSNELYPCYGGNGLRGYVKNYSHEGNINLIGRQGALCGNVKYTSGKFYATEHAVVTQPKANVNINTYWLHFVLRELDLNRLSTGAAQPGLTVGKLNEVEIPKVSIELQNKFADFVNQVDKLKSQMETSLKELEDNFKSLMQKAFKGELF